MTEAQKTTNLDELKNKLYEAFDKTLRVVSYYKAGNSASTANADAAYLEAAAKLADSISKVEREQREAKERGYNKLDKN
ncbi:MAG: hypothetical protein K8R48_00435 [Alphaproteobacteria bacterium]|nr:hypothetical protein [Alphaproteobacteria bacterium]